MKLRIVIETDIHDDKLVECFEADPLKWRLGDIGDAFGVGVFASEQETAYVTVMEIPPPTSTSEAHRDATYSSSTQERLRELLTRLTEVDGWNADPGVHALSDVIGRWDANDATEIQLEVQ